MATENEKLRKNNKDLKRWLDEKDTINQQHEQTIKKMNEHGAKVLARDSKQRAMIAKTKLHLQLANDTIDVTEEGLTQSKLKRKELSEELTAVKSNYRNLKANFDFSETRVNHLTDELDNLTEQISKARLSVETLVAVNHPNLNLEPAFRMVDGMSTNVTPHFENAVERTLFHVHSLLK